MRCWKKSASHSNELKCAMKCMGGLFHYDSG